MFLTDVRLTRLVAAFAAFILAAAAWAQPLPLAKPEEVGMSSQKLAKIGQVLKKEVEDGSFRGAVVMVARKGKLVYQDAVGMQTASAKMTTDSIFRIYSMTKPLVSVAAMMLVEDGTIQLTDPVSKYLPDFDKLQVSVPQKNDAGQGDLHAGAAGAADDGAGPAAPHLGPRLRRDHAERAGEGRLREGRRLLQGRSITTRATSRRPTRSRSMASGAARATSPARSGNTASSTDMLGRVVEQASGKRLGDFLAGARVRAARHARHRVLGAGGEDLARLAEPLAKDRFAGRPSS